jgi:hypothetical protein
MKDSPKAHPDVLRIDAKYYMRKQIISHLDVNDYTWYRAAYKHTSSPLQTQFRSRLHPAGQTIQQNKAWSSALPP